MALPLRNKPIAIIEDLKSISLYHESIETIIEINIDNILDWKHLILNISMEISNELHKLERKSRNHIKFYEAWQLHSPRIDRQNEQLRIDALLKIFEPCDRHALTHYLSNTFSYMIKTSYTLDNFPSIGDSLEYVNHKDTLFIRSQFSRKWENNNDLETLRFTLIKSFMSVKGLNAASPISEKIIENSVNSYKKISEQLTVILDLFLVAITTGGIPFVM